MDSDRFDDLVKRIGANSSRRRVLASLLGAAGASFGLGRASAATRKRSVGNSCNVNSDCITNLCVQESRTRKICHCVSAADCPAATDPCHTGACLPNGYCGMTVNFNAPCDDADACTTNDVCQADGSCAGAAIECGANASCTGGVCSCDGGAAATCTTGSCCPVGQICGPGDVCSPPLDSGNACNEGQDCVSGLCCPAGSAQAGLCGYDVGQACPNGSNNACCSGTCVDGFCQASKGDAGAACDPGDVADCNAGLNCCTDDVSPTGVACVDTNTSNTHCGACNAPCTGFTTCGGGGTPGVCGCRATGQQCDLDNPWACCSLTCGGPIGGPYTCE